MWVDVNNLVPYGLCEADILFCSNCEYMTHPKIVRWEDEKGQRWGKAVLPGLCPNCKAEMENPMRGKNWGGMNNGIKERKHYTGQ